MPASDRYTSGVTELPELLVLPEMQGLRLDQALARLLPGQSRSFFARCIEEGNVEVDGEVVSKTSHRVSAGQSISVRIPSPAAVDLVSQEIPIEILYQDSDVAVINKPAGLVVHPAAGHSDQTLVNALLFHIPDLSGIQGEIRPGIVHRLDKDTSGVMVVAKHDSAHRRLTAVWNSDAVTKEYVTVVYGTPRHDEGTIEAPIGRDPHDRKRMAVVAGGRNAITLYAVLERHRYASVLRCRLRTGRTHQIRVHLKSIGHPVVGDPLYAGPQWRGIPDKQLQKAFASVDRQALHAARLTFPHPSDGRVMTFEAPLPEDMAALIRALRAG
jgi:23S rRNA pseudouridine1911/1915/1917 synthase